MDQFQRKIGQKIAQETGAFEQRCTNQEREWAVVFLNEETLVIVLHGSLTATENTAAQSPAGLAQIQEFHRQLFADDSAILFQKIKNITGLGICDTAVEIDPMIGSVVLLFTTDTVGGRFLLPLGGPSDIVAPSHALPRWQEGIGRREANRTTGFPSRNDRPTFTKRISR